MVMVNISNGVKRPIRIAENVGISRQAIQKTLREMSHAGLIDIIRDPEDRRATIVSFSPRGQPIQEAARNVMGQIERELEQRVGKKQVQQLHETLERDWGALVVIEAD
jgi:DNA-binding MarR family transcriptional regulator